MNQSILFPDLQTWDASNQQVCFPAQQSGALIECVVSLGVLGRLSQQTIETPEQALSAFQTLRFELEELAEELIEEEAFDEKGFLVIE